MGLRLVSGLALTLMLAPVLSGARASELAVPDGWRTITFDGRPATVFRQLTDGSIRVLADRSAGMLTRDLEDAPSQACLTWRWRVDKALPPTDLTVKGEDDRAIGVMLSFPWDSGQATLRERLLRPMVEAREGAEAPGRVLAYVFGGEGERGAVLENPYLAPFGATILLRPEGATIGEWHEEAVDWAADHARVFGTSPSAPPNRITLVADSDDTMRSSEAVFDGPLYTAACAIPPAR